MLVGCPQLFKSRMPSIVQFLVGRHAKLASATDSAVWALRDMVARDEFGGALNLYRDLK